MHLISVSTIWQFVPISSCRTFNFDFFSQVISPMSITVVWNCSQITGSLIDINISNIFVRLTAGTVELLTKIFGSIGASTKTVEEEKELTNYSDAWDTKSIAGQDFWFLRPGK